MKTFINTRTAISFGACVLLLPMTISAATSTTPERSTIEERWKWDLTKMYAAPEDWEAHYKKLDSMVAEFAANHREFAGALGAPAA